MKNLNLLKEIVKLRFNDEISDYGKYHIIIDFNDCVKLKDDSKDVMIRNINVRKGYAKISSNKYSELVKFLHLNDLKENCRFITDSKNCYIIKNYQSILIGENEYDLMQILKPKYMKIEYKDYLIQKLTIGFYHNEIGIQFSNNGFNTTIFENDIKKISIKTKMLFNKLYSLYGIEFIEHITNFEISDFYRLKEIGVESVNYVIKRYYDESKGDVDEFLKNFYVGKSYSLYKNLNDNDKYCVDNPNFLNNPISLGKLKVIDYVKTKYSQKLLFENDYTLLLTFKL